MGSFSELGARMRRIRSRSAVCRSCRRCRIIVPRLHARLQHERLQLESLVQVKLRRIRASICFPICPQPGTLLGAPTPHQISGKLTQSHSGHHYASYRYRRTASSSQSTPAPARSGTARELSEILNGSARMGSPQSCHSSQCAVSVARMRCAENSG